MAQYLIKFTLHHNAPQSIRGKIETFIEDRLHEAEETYNGKHHNETRMVMKFQWQHVNNNTESLLNVDNIDERDIVRIVDTIGKYTFNLVAEHKIECDFLASKIIRYKNNRKAN